MAFAAEKLMEVDEFLHWQLRQEHRYELVAGIPLKMMTGASGMHDRIVTNIIVAFDKQLRGSRCRPTTADIALRTRIRSVRRPDVMVTCDPPRGDVYEALEPRLAVEVLSKSNTGVPWDRKLKEYRRHESLDYILLVDSEIVAVTLYQRTATGWDDVDADALTDVIELPKLKCRLALGEIYDDTGLAAIPPA